MAALLTGLWLSSLLSSCEGKWPGRREDHVGRGPPAVQEGLGPTTLRLQGSRARDAETTGRGRGGGASSLMVGSAAQQRAERASHQLTPNALWTPRPGHLVPPQPRHSAGSQSTHSEDPTTALKALPRGPLTKAL